MTPLEQIQLVDLLHQREREFIRIWQSEQKLREILPDYPLPPPPDLPSRFKPVTKKPAAKPTPPAPRHILRELLPDNGENVYKVVFRLKGEQQESFQIDRDLLERLIAVPSEEFQPLSIQAIDYRSPEDYTVKETIWESPTGGTGNLPDDSRVGAKPHV